MALDTETVRVINSYKDSTAVVRDRVLRFIDLQWNALDNYRDADINRFASRVTPVIEGGQQQIAAMTDSYLSSLERAVTGETSGVLGINPNIANDLSMRGIRTVDVYRRTGPTVWSGLSDGKSLVQSSNEALSRALSMGATDMQLAKTHTCKFILAKKKIVGYRRVLTGGESCALCYVASTQRYHKNQLMPIHPGCDCMVSPIYGDQDPGRVINSNVKPSSIQDSRLGEDAFKGKQARTSELRSQVVVHEHGEMGPVLARAGDRFTGPSDIAV